MISNGNHLEAHGAEVVDVDGHRYIDFCLGDTAAMTGHSPAPTVSAAQSQLEDPGVRLNIISPDARYFGFAVRRRAHSHEYQAVESLAVATGGLIGSRRNGEKGHHRVGEQSHTAGSEDGRRSLEIVDRVAA